MRYRLDRSWRSRLGCLGGLEPPHRRRRLSKGRDLPPPLLPLTCAACVPTKATTNSRLSRELEGGFFGCRKEKKFASPRKRGTSLLLRVEVQTRQAWSIVSTARRQRVRQHIGAPLQSEACLFEGCKSRFAMRGSTCMRTVVALAHQVDRRNPANHARFPACPLTRQLWDFLLEYDGGCKRGARRFGLSSSESAISFVKEFQKSGCSNYCLCDLTCWCCLAG